MNYLKRLRACGCGCRKPEKPTHAILGIGTLLLKYLLELREAVIFHDLEFKIVEERWEAKYSTFLSPMISNGTS
jgi:hypothetical protein